MINITPNVPFIQISNELPESDIRVLCIPENCFSEDGTIELPEYIAPINEALGNLILDSIKLEKFKGKLNTHIVVNTFGRVSAQRLLIIGGGNKDNCDAAQVRSVSSYIARQVHALKADTMSMEVCEKLLELDTIRSVVEVSILAPYDYTKFKTVDKESYTGLQSMTIVTSASINQEMQAALEKGVLSAKGVLLARELVILPPNEATPVALAELAQSIADRSSSKGLSVKVLDKAECEKLGMGAFLAVARGSKLEPKFMHFHYKPLHPQGEKIPHVAIVGKGVCFDSGGLSLKPSKSMEKMKYDMAGGAAVLGLMSIVADLQPNVEITAVVAACENMPSGDSFRLGDVITAMNGKTIEILNTDAEGRVTLADALHYANLQNPDHIIDLATLTGAVVVALGEAYAGVMTNDQECLDKLKLACDKSGEQIWQLPLCPAYEENIKKGTIADMINTGSRGQAGSQNGGVFLKQFVGDTPWVHIDIAGTCWPEQKDTSFTPKNNPSGFGVLSLVRHLENLS